jgi:hypothetical protein
MQRPAKDDGIAEGNSGVGQNVQFDRPGGRSVESGVDELPAAEVWRR